MYSRKLQILRTAYIHTLELSEPITHSQSVQAACLTVKLQLLTFVDFAAWAMGNGQCTGLAIQPCNPAFVDPVLVDAHIRVKYSVSGPHGKYPETSRETLLRGFLGFRKGCARCKSPTSPRGLTMFCAVLEMALTMRILRSIYYDDGLRAWSPMFQTRQSNPED